MQLACVFPGQGSQSVGMLAALAHEPLVMQTFAEAAEALGYDLWQRCQEGPAGLLNATECTQPAMLCAGVATYRAWRARGGPVPAMMAGHSLGEFSALVAAGYLDFVTAIHLVRYRGELMQAAVPADQGAMAAVLGLEDEDVRAACREAARDEIVEAVNFNAPAQVVIAGHASAVSRAIDAALGRGARRALRLPISVPAHSSLMQPAAHRLQQRLQTTPIAPCADTAVYGVRLRPHDGPDEIRSGLVQQLHTPVYWADTVRAMIAAGADTFLECGPGKVLTGLNRRIEKRSDLKVAALEDPAAFDQALQLCGGVAGNARR